MSDKAEKLAAAKKKFKEFQNRKQKKDAAPPEQLNLKSPDFLYARTESSANVAVHGSEKSISNSPSSSLFGSNSNGVDSDFGTLALRLTNQDGTSLSSGAHSRNSSVSVVDYQYDVLHSSHTNSTQLPSAGQTNSVPFYNRCTQFESAAEDHKLNGSILYITESKLVADTPESRRAAYSSVASEHSPSSHSNRTLLRQFSQMESESVRSSPELNNASQQLKDLQQINSSQLNSTQQSNESHFNPLQQSLPSESQQFNESQRLSDLQLNESRLRQKKNLLDFQSSKSSSAESEKTNANSTSSDSMAFPRRTDSVSTLYSSSDNQERKLSYGVGDSFEHADVLELERRVEELAAMLHKERAKSGDTRMALNTAESRVKELEKKVEGYRSTQNELSALQAVKGQIKNYVQTIEILVSEKTELERALDQCRHEVTGKNAQLDEYRSKSNAAQRHTAEMEMRLAQGQDIVESLQRRLQELESKKHEMEELKNDLTEARAKLESKSNELRRMEERLRETESQLSLATLRVQQLSNNDGAENCDNELKVLQELNSTLTTKVATLEQSLRVLELERDNSTAHYQSYVRSLNTELSSLRSQFEGLNIEKDRLVVREQSLVQHVAELEKQLQTHQVKIDELSARTLVARQDNTEQKAEEKVSALEEEKQSLKEKLIALMAENEKLAAQNTFNESKLEQLEAEQIDMSSLQVTLESDRVAASRAIQQNNELKQRLQELQDAFIKLSNEKLELTEKLQHEESVNKDYAEKLEQEKSRSKDYVEKLQYEQSRSKDFTQKVIDSSQRVHENGINHEGVVEEAQLVETETEPLISTDVVCQTEAETRSQMNVEAVAKLEEKFRKKMKELADLSDEKQRLEHLVMQLQSETETIGEYVALYQLQRGALQEKAKEKDQQVVKLAQDKENLRNKLAELTELIQNLISKQGAPLATCPSSSAGEGNLINGESNVETIDTHQIMSLLSDIGSTSLNQPASNFHPCPWCSGQLITV